MKIFKAQTGRNESGFALIMALIISSVVLSIGLSLLSITIKQADLSATARESEVAFQVASAAMECALLTRVQNSADIITQTPASQVTFDCGDVSQTVTRMGTNSVREYVVETDWPSPSGNMRFVKIEMFVVNAINSAVPFSRHDFSRVCNAGNYCTYVFAQGYNHSQSEVASGASFTVQRELTAEF